jgi:hypothetical protein
VCVGKEEELVAGEVTKTWKGRLLPIPTHKKPVGLEGLPQPSVVSDILSKCVPPVDLESEGCWIT